MKIKLPFIVYEITPHCNLACKYCYNIWKRPQQQKPRVASYGKVIKTLRRLFKIADVPHVTMSGGEPFTFSRFKEVVLFCRLQKKTVTIISNGSGKREDYAQLIQMGTGLFEFSVHSPDEKIHDQMAGRDGAWKRAIESVTTVRQLGGDVVVVIVITRLNYRHIGETIRFLKDLGIRRIMLNRFNIGGAGIGEAENIGLTNDQMRLAFDKAHRVIKSTGISATSNVCTPFCVINPKNYPLIPFSACYPRALDRRPWTLDPEGNVRFCNHSPNVVGNIFKNSFEEMMQSDYIRQWQEAVPEVCAECNLFTKCWAGCRAACEQLGLPLSCADPLVYAEKGLKIPG